MSRDGIIHAGPSGRGYRVWPNGDGAEVFREDGARMHDVGSHVPVIPLVDVPFVAGLLSALPQQEKP